MDPSASASAGKVSRLGVMRAIAAVVVLEAVRGRMLWLMLVVVLTGVGLSAFTAAVAITESRELVRGLLGAWLRLSAVIVTALFVASSMVRDWNDKGMELVLSLAVPRAVYLLGRLLGYWLVAAGAVLCCAAVLALFAPPAQVAVWAVSLACELFIVAALAVLCLLTFTHVTLGLSAVFGFYLLARTIAAIQLIGSSPLLGLTSAVQTLVDGTLWAIAFLLPDLDRFTRSEWLVYGEAGGAELIPVLLQTAVYLLLLCGAALFDLERKVL